MQTAKLSFTIGEHFATYIEYGETDHLDPVEVEIFDAFFAGVKALAKPGWSFAHWSITDSRDEFSKCEASGLFGATLEIDAIYRKD